MDVSRVDGLCAVVRRAREFVAVFCETRPSVSSRRGSEDGAPSGDRRGRIWRCLLQQKTVRYGAAGDI